MSRRYPVGSHSLHYLGVGHSGDPTTVWALVRGTLQTWDPVEGSHLSRYGSSELAYWHGRFEIKTKRVTVVSPDDGNQHRITPRWLVDRLERQFGTGLDIFAYNPPMKEAK